MCFCSIHPSCGEYPLNMCLQCLHSDLRCSHPAITGAANGTPLTIPLRFVPKTSELQLWKWPRRNLRGIRGGMFPSKRWGDLIGKGATICRHAFRGSRGRAGRSNAIGCSYIIYIYTHIGIHHVSGHIENLEGECTCSIQKKGHHGQQKRSTPKKNDISLPIFWKDKPSILAKASYEMHPL